MNETLKKYNTFKKEIKRHNKQQHLNKLKN